MEDEWRDMSRMGSMYREEYNTATGQWRHQRIVDLSGRMRLAEWEPGKAPDNKEA